MPVTYTETYTNGETCVLTAIPDECCVFSHWIDDRNPCAVYSTSTVIEVLVTDNLHFQAIFKPKTVKVNVLLNYPYLGTTTGSGVYECGSEITISATTSCCYNIAWPQNGPCAEFTDVDEWGTCPDCYKTITCTLTVYDDIDIYAEIEPAYYTASVRACPEEGGNVGMIQNQITPFTPTENGVPCIPVSNNPVQYSEDFYKCIPITYIASPNNGYVFIGWALTNSSDNTCKPCETETDFYSDEPSFTETPCDDEGTYLVACFRRHYLIRFVFDGCDENSGAFAYSINGGEEQYYTTPFYVFDDCNIQIINKDDKCCKFIGISLDGTHLLPTEQFVPTSDTTVHIFSEKVCKTITLYKIGCSDYVDVVYGECGGNKTTYEGPINVISGSCYEFEISNETTCCELVNWRVFTEGTITTVYDDTLVLTDIEDDVIIQCTTIQTDKILTINMSGYVGKLFVVIQNVDTNEFYTVDGCVGNLYELSFQCETNLKVYVSTCDLDLATFKIDSTSQTEKITWILGMLLDENNNEYTSYYHAFFENDGVFFMYDNVNDEHTCFINGSPYKGVNAMVIDLFMNRDKTITFDFTVATKVRSNNQHYFYNNQDSTIIYSEDATLQDFNCPFISNCQPVAFLQKLC